MTPKDLDNYHDVVKKKPDEPCDEFIFRALGLEKEIPRYRKMIKETSQDNEPPKDLQHI